MSEGGAIMKNEEGFLSLIQSAVADYCYDNNDKNFETTVHITANDGWVKASKIEEECNEQTSDDLRQELERFIRDSYHEQFAQDGAQDIFDWDDVESFIEEAAYHFAKWQKSRLESIIKPT